MRLAILGAGAAGLGCAAAAAARGHAVTLWSPRGGGTRGIVDSIAAEGAVTGRLPVRVAADLGRGLAEADVVLLVVPGHAQPPLLHRLAAALLTAPPVLVAPATALSPLLLDGLLAARGVRATVGALAAPPIRARRLGPDRVWLDGPQPLRVGAVPAAAASRVAGFCAALFGTPVEVLTDALAAALVDPAPLARATEVLTPADPAAAPRLLAALVAERDALARALGLALPGAAPAPDEAAEPPPPDPARALAEVPHALSFLLALGRAAAVPLPVTEAVLTLFEVLAGRPLRANAVLAELDVGGLARQLQLGAAG